MDDVFGVSGRLIIKALQRGQATPEEMAELAIGQLRKKLEIGERKISLYASGNKHAGENVDDCWRNAAKGWRCRSNERWLVSQLEGASGKNPG